MKVECPVCGMTNDPEADHCARCGCPQRNHTRLSTYATQLFNQGLASAKSGNLPEARELFAAVVHWMPKDRKARNALALANFELGDQDRARFHWNCVLAQRPSDPFATQGLKLLSPPHAGPLSNVDPPTATEPPKPTEPPAATEPDRKSVV